MIIRLCDIIFSCIALILLMPLFVPIVIILKYTGEGEIFYIQDRVGKGGRIFGLIKFATMLKDSPKIGTGMITVKNDPRILPFGKFLRKTKINELPQIINVLKGDMSIIGPRPQTIRCFNAFPPDVQEEIKKVKPGLSGIGSIVFRDEEIYLEGKSPKEIITFYDEVIAPYKGELEKWYVKNRSLKLYFLLIFLTIWVIFFPRSRIYEEMFPDLPERPKELLEKEK